MNSNNGLWGVYQGPQPPPKALSEMTQEEQAEAGAQQFISFMQSCPGKTAMAGVSGFALGGFFGLFMASMAYDVPVGTDSVKHISELPFKQQMKLQFGDMAKRSYSSAKNFGYIGLVYSGVECAIESFRAKHDLYNGVSAGCITGAGLAIKAGPQAAFVGCAGFAAFSLAIDTYLNSDSTYPPKNDYDT
ncbi:Mitochondrial import inner membrane translocase subunit tim22 [Lodderomyces elongisporus]|uniref:Mitochondrial import inner membrane translocase subunit tim22 n=1 Tax=Lodderomyces elongisporus TaxID=36914 RepID=UPI00292312F0|nr:Mitochondrial import inner membrane translocase subunit tim22 [Lodderomyces elongisporus]WLF79492.1 Mitochondrial import inner membrane translocase subunit tim22 [Lodderomyces elongisporus]